MKRRNFLSMFAGAGLAVLAARTGLAESAIKLTEPVDDGVALNCEAISYNDYNPDVIRYKRTERYAYDGELGEHALEEVIIEIQEAPHGQALVDPKRVMSMTDPSAWYIKHEPKGIKRFMRRSRRA